MKRVCDCLRQNAACIWFCVLYTAVFFVITRFIGLFLPLILGGLLYFLISPVSRFLQRRLHFSVKASAYTACIVCFLMLLLLVVFLIFLLCREAAQLFNGESYFRMDDLSPPVRNFLCGMLDRIPELTKNITNDITGALSTVLPYAGSTMKLFLSVPAILIFPVLAFTFTGFCLLHRRKLRRLAAKILGPNAYLCLRHTIKAQSGHSSGLVFSYFLIYLITFSEACIVLFLLNMPYPLITALIVTISDIFPILGPGAVMLPLCLYRLLCGSYAQAIGLLAGWLLITIIRQIIEPRLISKISRTPGIVMLAAVYAGLVFGNFWLIPYTALFFYLHRLLSDAGIFKSEE